MSLHVMFLQFRICFPRVCETRPSAAHIVAQSTCSLRCQLGHNFRVLLPDHKQKLLQLIRRWRSWRVSKVDAHSPQSVLHAQSGKQSRLRQHTENSLDLQQKNAVKCAISAFILQTRGNFLRLCCVACAPAAQNQSMRNHAVCTSQQLTHCARWLMEKSLDTEHFYVIKKHAML